MTKIPLGLALVALIVVAIVVPSSADAPDRYCRAIHKRPAHNVEIRTNRPCREARHVAAAMNRAEAMEDGPCVGGQFRGYCDVEGYRCRFTADFGAPLPAETTVCRQGERFVRFYGYYVQ
jgi:hypothetical protein